MDDSLKHSVESTIVPALVIANARGSVYVCVARCVRNAAETRKSELQHRKPHISLDGRKKKIMSQICTNIYQNVQHSRKKDVVGWNSIKTGP